MSRELFGKVVAKYEAVKTSVQEKWAGFKQKFEGTKTEMSQEVLSAKSPEDLIALGKKLQEQGEALKLEEENVKQEESQGESAEEVEKNEVMGDMQLEAGEMNAEFDENKAVEKAEAEKAEAERVAAEAYALESAEKDKARIAEIQAGLKGEGAVAIENAEQIEKSPEEKKYEFFKGTMKFDENGKMDGLLITLGDNPLLMAEAYKKNPENIRWVSKRLSSDPIFVEQMKSMGARVSEDGVLEGVKGHGFSSVDATEKISRDNFEKAKIDAVAFNLAKGSRSLEEMGVDKEFARTAIKDGLLKSLNYFGNNTTFNDFEQIKRAMEYVGGTAEEMINDPDIRKTIIESAIPRMCNHLDSDKSAKWVNERLVDLEKTFGVTKSEWDQAEQGPSGGVNVRNYLNSRHNF